MDKGLNCNKIMLSENDQIISDETTIADTMNKHFVIITKKLKLKPTKTETNQLSLSGILDTRFSFYNSIFEVNVRVA